MTQEEKAKRYDEALEMAKKLIENEETNVPVFYVNNIKDIFPELKESEDERIRIALYLFVEAYGAHANYEVTQEEMLAWLEKQGEQKHTYHKFRAGDIIRHIKQGFTCKIDSVDTEYRVSECGSGTHLPFEAEDYYELVEQKPVEWSEEDDNRINRLIAYFEDRESISAEDDLIYANWLKSLKDKVQPKQDWSEEDELRVENLIAILEGKGYPDYIAWLEDLKDRRIPQPKAEWSEEDDIYLDDVLHIIDTCSPKVHTIMECINWLKSLRPQNRWKPSDEQIKALANALSLAKNYGEESAFDLRTLYEQLKRLKG